LALEAVTGSRLKRSLEKFFEIEMPLTKVLAEMEEMGFCWT